jgi:CHAT domain-containing protein/Tfp pilus assembly protein PilF
MSLVSRPKVNSQAAVRRPCLLVLPVLLLLAPILLVSESRSQDPSKVKPLTVQQQERLLERDQLDKDSQKARAAGKLAEAIAALEKGLAIEREVLGESDVVPYRSMQSLARLCAVNGDFEAARRWVKDSQQIQSRVQPPLEWTLSDAPRTLATIEQFSKLDAKQLDRLREAVRLLAEADELGDENKYKEALPLVNRAVEIYKQELGQQSQEYLLQLNFLGWLYMAQGDYARAEPLIREALEGFRKAIGEDHPSTATSHNALGLLCLSMKRFSEAEVQFRQAADGHRRTQGKLAKNYASSLANLAETFKQAKEYRRAEALRQEVLEITRQVQGESHKDFASALMELAFVHMYLGEYDKAEPLLKQALEIYQKTLGPKHPTSITCLRNLSYTYRELGKLDEALTLELQGFEIQKQILPPDDRRLALNLSNIGAIYQSKNDYVKALELERRALEIFHQGEGEQSQDFKTCLGNVGWFCEQIAIRAQKRGDFAAARPAYTEAIKIYSDLYGKEHWRVKDLRLQLSYANQLEKMTADQRRQLTEADELYKRAETVKRRTPGDALAPAEQAWAIRRKLLGDEHWVTLDAEFQVSYVSKELGDYAKAEPLYQALPELLRKAKGELHPDYVVALQNLANLDEALGKSQEAESIYEQALAIAKKMDAEENRETAVILANLASLYIGTSRYEKVEPLYRQAIAIRKRIDGPRSAGYADDVLRLAGFFMFNLNDNVKAEPLIRESIEVYKAALGDQDPRYARAIDYLGTYYLRTKHFDLAGPLYEQALAIRKQTLGEKHFEYGKTLNNLACLYMDQGEYARAEPLFVQALEIKRGLRDGDTALSLGNLAWAYSRSGKYDKAEPLLREAVEIRKRELGVHHPDYAESLSKLAAVYLLLDDPARGAPMAREAVHLAREQLDRNETFQSERQQLVARTRLWFVLDNYIDLSGAAQLPADEVYGEVLNWKGLVSAGQQQLHRLHRQLKASGNKEVARLESELEAATGQLATLYRATNLKNRELQFRLEEQSERIEQIQKQLAGVSAEFRQQLAQQYRTVDDIRRALPPDAVLVDLVNYERVLRADGGKATVERTALVAFVVHHEGAVDRIELGSTGPIEKAIADWRKSFGRKTDGDDPAEVLRQLVWQPLEKHLAGAKTLLISPNGLTAPIPWPALRLQGPDSYLIDKYAVAIVPIARLLPELIAREPVQASASQRPSVLLVGDVDFGAMPGKSDLAANSRSAARGNQAVQWMSLPGTREEVAAIRQSITQRFGEQAVTELTGQQATESTIRQQAEKHRYLHFSTHGFFAPPEVPSALGPASLSDRSGGSPAAAQQDVSGYHPGLLSGLVLAGANRPIDEGNEDGILTALEVAEMDLGEVELATLSACETGLGATGGGEGLLGLQRAFQAAGAKTVIAGLWKVPDKATQVLMSRFYDNLWQKRMTKAEALREAQLWMLREGALPNAQSTRGLEIDEAQPVEDGKQLPPYYWGAFILSGDWR